MWRTLSSGARSLAPFTGALLVLSALGAEELPFTSTFPSGLTKGATDKYYTSVLDLDSPLLLKGSGEFMAAARADARLRRRQDAPTTGEEFEGDVKEYLTQASKKRSQFLDSDVVYDREEIKTALHHVLVEKGQLVLLMGGKSLGKSTLLKELAKQKKPILGHDGAERSLLYVDARSCGGDLTEGLLAALQSEMREQQRLLKSGDSNRVIQSEQAAESIISRLFTSPKSVSLELSYKGVSIGTQLDFLDGPSNVDQSIALLSKVSEAAKSQGQYFCLIIDEANLAFPAPPDPFKGLPSPPLTLKQLNTQRQLEKLVELTKQNRQMNVLLVSSEYAYPYRLLHGNFFNITNLTRTLFAGEVSPADMRILLRDKWGLGPHLSDVFLAFFGGHVHMASQALALLAQQLDDFDCLQVAPKGVSSSISFCLSVNDGGAMLAMLTALAQKGFAPVSTAENVSAQAISRANIGGLVDACDTVAGLPKGLRMNSRYGLVPSSQFAVSHD